MAYVSKTWVDRDSQYPTRRIIVHPDLTEEQVTVRRDEGIVTTQGDVFDANTMNNMEARIAAGFREKQDELTAGSGITIDANNVISANGGGGASALDDLTDVDVTNPTNGQALLYDSGNSKWVNGNVSASSTLAGLSDTTISNPQNGQVLKYNSTSQKWENANESGGGGATYTAGDNIEISAQNVISAKDTTYQGGKRVSVDAPESGSTVGKVNAFAQNNIIWNGDCLAGLPNKFLHNGWPFGVSDSTLPFGTYGFSISDDGSADYKTISYSTAVPFQDSGWYEDLDKFILELYWTDDTSTSPVVEQKEVIELEVDSSESIEINGFDISAGIYVIGGNALEIRVEDSTNALGSIWITRMVLTPKNDKYWNPKDAMVEKLVSEHVPYTEATGTLSAGSTSLTISNAAIRSDSTLDFYTNVYGVSPKTVTVSTGSVTMTFDGQQTAINVKVRIS